MIMDKPCNETDRRDPYPNPRKAPKREHHRADRSAGLWKVIIFNEGT